MISMGYMKLREEFGKIIDKNFGPRKEKIKTSLAYKK